MKNNRFAKRHYEAIAERVQTVRVRVMRNDGDVHTEGLQQAAIDLLVDELASMFAGDNGQFDRGRFARACVAGANVRARS